MCKGEKKSEETFNLLAEYKNESSSKAIYSDISEQTLVMASKIYFSLVFCPDKVHPTVEFYQNLFDFDLGYKHN